jgi:hypothetical protein
MSQQPTKNENQELARQIAEDFGEPEEFGLFVNLLKRYPESLIRRAYEETQSIPLHKIRKSKAAVFLYLVKKYARQGHQHQWNPPSEEPSGDGTELDPLPPVPTPPDSQIPNQ